jgi:uncharacterized protein (TIGR02453 family)
MDAAFILQFLADLRDHNDREWFATQTDRYQEVRAQFQEFVGEVLLSLADVRPAFGAQDPAKVIYRIYRDVRFSKDKTPYKTTVSALIGEGGKNTNLPCGYFQLEPGGKSFVVCGLYEPTTAQLHQVREAIAADPGSVRAILKSMKKHYPNGFTGARSNRVRGVTPEHPAYDLLLFKSYIAARSFTDDQVRAKTFPAQLKASLHGMFPLVDWLSTACQTARPTLVLSADERRQIKRGAR